MVAYGERLEAANLKEKPESPSRGDNSPAAAAREACGPLGPSPCPVHNAACFRKVGKKTKFNNDEDRDENGAAGTVKRAREETDKEEPASKQQKAENGAGDQ
ncbi:Lupus La protein-like protein [Sciurus carolinensis]|uniref:Lupus La protein-like protein n=1 Tax=Sciurus carolinensis TaxID=30640 RepID=A0AA41SY75_SCICA|nr:Lupus La protein-like protein [Sciurus carolinensis]